MDPQQTLFEIMENLHKKDRMESIKQLEALTEWLECGGFCPQVFVTTQPDMSKAYGVSEHAKVRA